MTDTPHRPDLSPQETRAPAVLRDADGQVVLRAAIVKPDINRGTEVVRETAKNLPATPGVYRFIGAQDEVLYVGKARALSKRVISYASLGNLPGYKRRMVAETLRIETTGTHTEPEALLLEANIIKQHRPRYNILLRDDKSYPFIALYQDHDYPVLVKHRNVRHRKGRYFGPFASAGSVKRTLDALQKAFLLRNCKDHDFANRRRPCMQYQIKRCTAPCVGYVSKEEYAQQVALAVAYLEGKSRTVQGQFAEEMQAASERLEFEVAARYRDRIKALTIIQSTQDVHVEGIQDADILALHRAGGAACIEVLFYRGGQNYGSRSFFPDHEADASDEEVLTAFIGQFYQDKPAAREVMVSHPMPEAALLAEALSLTATVKVKLFTPQRGPRRRLVDNALTNARHALERHQAESASQRRYLEGVATLFGLADRPERIEVYDNSHIQGANAYGAMIVAGADGFLKKHYRKFSIKDPGAAGNDVAMMREVMRRRFARAQTEDPDRDQGVWPDLVLIDGGLPQLNAALAELTELGITDVPLVGVAKGPDRDAGRERFFIPGRDPFLLPPNDEVLFFLQRLRDEAHRFAIGSHRKGREKAISLNPLDEIPGIGPKRKKALMLHFGSAKAIKKAGLKDLSAVEGISEAVAQKVYDWFHGGEGAGS